MQPFSYILVVLSVYGIYLMLSKNMMLEYAESMKETMISISGDSSMNKSFDFVDIMKFVQDNNTVITFATIPIFALINKFIFKQRNFIEHIVLLLYSMATVTVVSTIIGFLGYLFNINYGYTNNLNEFLFIIYSIYYYKKLFKLDGWEITLKTLYFWLLLIPIYLQL